MNLQAHGQPLRFRLFLLAASGLLPLAIVAGVVLAYVAGERQRDAQQSALAVSRALSTTIDSELRAIVGVLESLALSDQLEPQRIAEFHALSGRVATAQGWRSVVLADGSGRVLQSSNQRLDEARPEPAEPESMQRAIASRRPTVGTVTVGPGGTSAFAVRVPVLRGTEVRYVLSAVIPVDHVLSVLMRQNVPATSVVSVFDQKLNRVARSRQHTTQRPSPSLQKLLETGGAEGVGISSTLEGIRSHTGYTRVPTWNWTVVTGITAAEISSGIYGVLGTVGAGLLASLALAAFVAWYFARDVTEPIDQLKRAAGALGRGEPVHLPPLQIAELQEVGQALERASTERDRAAQEREVLLARATDALNRAEEASRSKDEFLAMLGHELRNPLAPMATALHLMARKGDPGTKLEREVMERQVSHMKRLVDDLLDVSRITGKRLEMRMQPLRVADLVRHAGQSVRPVLGLRKLDVRVEPDAESLWISGDEVRLGQVLNNLLGNAVKFTGPHGTITLQLRRDGERAEIAVTDTGLGMSPEVLAHVFDLFYQAPQGADRSLGGLGLGLAIVRSLVEMHGGSVEASSEGEGHGSTFTLRFPTIAAPAPVDATNEGTLRDGKGRVLLVDDNQDAADTAGTLLELSGYDVRIAYDPGVALAELERFAPQVAVLDIGLPGMSGYELAARVQQHRNGRGCHLIALTGYGTAADIAKAGDAGFRQHLVKPAGPNALLEAVQRGLQQHAGEPS